MKKIAVVLGSKNDLPTMMSCVETLQKFGVPYEVRILSAHRTPNQALAFARDARANGFGAIIAAAGMAAHLGGVLASSTTLPVIAVPLSGGINDGIDALYAAVQMPRGVPVACVAVGGAVNSALLAIQMLGIEDASLAEKLETEKKAMEETVLSFDEEVRKL
ncbi:MAG: 5-(carboxyamino)imidazole ribonucleotide mutase [Clostridia bacterium]|nr:5-(carboxyamino)imidazole ribonucleotide mutase [Clostridia bacterium]